MGGSVKQRQANGAAEKRELRIRQFWNSAFYAKSRPKKQRLLRFRTGRSGGAVLFYIFTDIFFKILII